ncbi:MAG TPA: PAS domain S-box protein, partial [Candidatus Binatia bacterium]|nr:PAS domain S-box protein [Candidatus Binatia bacterium]
MSGSWGPTPQGEIGSKGWLSSMGLNWKMNGHVAPDPIPSSADPSAAEAESILKKLAGTYAGNLESLPAEGAIHHFFPSAPENANRESPLPNLEAKYRALVEQLPAVVFMAYLDRGAGEAYVSPHIEAALGFSQAEWLEDPVLWYRHIHPEDKMRWSAEASEMFTSGKPLRSAYRVIARDGHVIWFHCEAKMIRHVDGSPWFIHGVAFDITDLKRTEEELEDERNIVSAILDTVGALVIVLDREGRIVRFNRTCEQMTGESSERARGRHIWELFAVKEEREQFQTMFRLMSRNELHSEYESTWRARDGSERTIAWSAAVLPAAKRMPSYTIAS